MKRPIQSNIVEAILFATEKHGEQCRKGTDLPYIVHPMEVMNILIRMNGDEDLVTAGILHDTVEDTDATLQEIDLLFGSDVAQLVAAHTHPKRGDWWETRQAAIEQLRTAPHRVKLLILADKLSNLRSMAYDYAHMGDKLWERFNAPKKMQSRYYSAAIDAMEDLQADPDAAWAYWELNALYKDVFVEFYITEDHMVILQRAAHGDTYYLTKHGLLWNPLPPDLQLFPISRREAEFIEDLWRRT